MRRRRTRAQVETLERQILDILRPDYPQSVRHVFYRLTDPNLAEPVAKTEHGYKQVVGRLIAMRRAGTLPYGWISDSTRRGYHVTTYANPGEAISQWAGLYRRDLWTGQAQHVEVWTESRSLAGVIEDTCRELAVSLYPAGGFSSLSQTYEAAEYIRAVFGQDGAKQECVILYCGDYDPAGVLIDGKIRDELRGHLEPEGIPVTLRRLAISKRQITRYSLPTKPRKPGERRRLDIAHTVEAEAMPAGILRGLVRAAVESYLPAHALNAAKAAEESEREGLGLLGLSVAADGLNGFIDLG